MSSPERTLLRDAGGQRGRARALAASARLLAVGSVVVLAAFWIAMTFASPYFLTTTNVSNMLQAAAIPTALALGQLVVILTGAIDLSVGATYVLVGVVGARFTHDVTANGAVVIMVMLAVGGLVGLANGVLIEYGRVGCRSWLRSAC